MFPPVLFLGCFVAFFTPFYIISHKFLMFFYQITFRVRGCGGHGATSLYWHPFFSNSSRSFRVTVLHPVSPFLFFAFRVQRYGSSSPNSLDLVNLSSNLHPKHPLQSIIAAPRWGCRVLANSNIQFRQYTERTF